jgi:hypothetical protein
MNFEQEKTDNNISSRQPIFIVVLLILLSGAGFYYFNQQITNSMTSILSINTDSYSVAQDPVIDFQFLNSDEFKNLESFPDYPSFKEDDDLNIAPGKANPFSPSGIRQQQPTKVQNQVVQDAATTPDSKTAQ